jgi:homogentisate 1,2-dioxygenase
MKLEGAYLAGFGNEFATEAVPNALPDGQNSPRRHPLGLVSELLSGATFTAPRAQNRRSYLFRIRPSVGAPEFELLPSGDFRTPPFAEQPSPNPFRWNPFEIGDAPADFIDGLATICGSGSPRQQCGLAIHVYRANRSMSDRVFSNADGEFLILPQEGELEIVTELGVIHASPGDAVLIPRSIGFKVALLSDRARGFVCENYGRAFQLPELGLIGSNGLASPVDFLTPVAAFEDRSVMTQLVHKFGGALWTTHLDHSPFDVVAWRGNYAPCKYDMFRFAPIGMTRVDHADPSVYSALTSPSDGVLGPNADFMVLPPRWVVTENTFRPPGFHRNCVTEFIGVIIGRHESKGEDFRPGASSLHNPSVPHGPDLKTFEGATKSELPPSKLEDTMVFMIESRFAMEVTPFALHAPERQFDYAQIWRGFPKNFTGG